MSRLPLFLILSVYLISAERCYDQSDFCRYLKTFCRSKDHESLMMVKCAATCGFCKEEEVEVARNESLVKSRPNETATEKTTTTPKKCVFPKEKMLPNNRTDYTFNANVSVVQRNNETVQTVLVQITNSTRVQQAPDSNEALKRVAEVKRNESAFEEEGEEEEVRNTQVMRKIKLNQLINENDMAMPRITTAEPSKFSVSLSKTLIKGKCFNEYLYCAEFVSLCTHPAFGDVMASHCTLTCQRCDDVDMEDDKDRADCADNAPDCSKYADLCHDGRYLSLAQKFCPKTCGFCKPLCRDRHQNCDQFALDGFCSDETYTVDERRHLCGSTCGSC